MQLCNTGWLNHLWTFIHNTCRLNGVIVTASGNYATHCVTLGGGTTYGGIYGTLRNSCWWASTCVYLLFPPRAAQNPLHIVFTSCSLSSYKRCLPLIAHCTLCIISTCCALQELLTTRNLDCHHNTGQVQRFSSILPALL